MAAVIRRFSIRSRQIGPDFPELISTVRQRCVLTGQRVSLITAGEARKGTVEGIADSGELLFRSEKGLERLIQADEVRLLLS